MLDTELSSPAGFAATENILAAQGMIHRYGNFAWNFIDNQPGEFKSDDLKLALCSNFILAPSSGQVIASILLRYFLHVEYEGRRLMKYPRRIYKMIGTPAHDTAAHEENA